MNLVPLLDYAAVTVFALTGALVASLLWFVTTVYSIGYMRGNRERNQTRFYICFAIAIFGAMGVAMSANLFTLFLFYEALTLVTYPLVGHKETAEAKAGARKYVIYLRSGRERRPAKPRLHLEEPLLDLGRLMI